MESYVALKRGDGIRLPDGKIGIIANMNENCVVVALVAPPEQLRIESHVTIALDTPVELMSAPLARKAQQRLHRFRAELTQARLRSGRYRQYRHNQRRQIVRSRHKWRA